MTTLPFLHGYFVWCLQVGDTQASAASNPHQSKYRRGHEQRYRKLLQSGEVLNICCSSLEHLEHATISYHSQYLGCLHGELMVGLRAS